ncbi:hypothetical protein [Cohnella hongkongensis]|uniref:CobQ/CobB/MinD/ParA nucleotide binding domain-containing protein n=1 Tax=Cohnella hongkongensis TaxID=178337 RepID=A0ABV9FJS7_9BACL
MVKRIVLAAAEREYVAKLAEYLREEEKSWEVAAYTHDSALRRELQSGGRIDALIGEREMIGPLTVSSSRIGKVVVLSDESGTGRRGEEEVEEWVEISRYQPLPALLSCIRGSLGADEAKLEGRCQIWTVFSASGGVGKTTVALNLVRQAGERGLRVLYLNLEELNATSLLFGRGEPDGLSRLLYALQAHPEQWEEQSRRLCRHQPQLRADYIDAPEHPGERLALTPDVARELIDKLKSGNRYDVIVVDPDSGAGEWHLRLLEQSDRIVWLTLDDAQCLLKAEKLHRHWETRLDGAPCRVSYVMNKFGGGRSVNRWPLPGAAPEMALPYAPEWKTVDQPGRLLSSPAYSGAVERLLDLLGADGGRSGTDRRRRGEGYGGQRAYDRGAG